MNITEIDLDLRNCDSHNRCYTFIDIFCDAKSLLNRTENRPVSADILFVQSDAKFYRIELCEAPGDVFIHLNNDFRLTLTETAIQIDDVSDINNPRLRYFKFMSYEQITEFKQDLVMKPDILEETGKRIFKAFDKINSN